MADSLDLLVCATCGVQHSTTSASSCKVCDDPRQYLPASGQQWTSLRKLQNSKKYHNEFTQVEDGNPNLISIHTVPQVAIGQRALLCLDASGDERDPGNPKKRNNVLWDCITYIDEATVRRINELGGLCAIVISHPHFYSTNLEWAAAFDCPVYLAKEDEEFIMRRGPRQRLWEGTELSLPVPRADIVAIKAGGHFPGSSVLWWKSARKLLVADTIMVVPSGIYHGDRLPGTTSFSFMWSYPNMIPLTPDAVHGIWKAIKDADFEDVHGGFPGRSDTKGNAKKRVLESAQIIIKAMGYLDHVIHQEVCE